MLGFLCDLAMALVGAVIAVLLAIYAGVCILTGQWAGAMLPLLAIPFVLAAIAAVLASAVHKLTS